MDDTMINATRTELVAAFEAWDKQARSENWPDKPNAAASADHLIALLTANKA